MPYTVPSYLQPGVYAEPGTDLYNQRVAYNTRLGVPGGGIGGPGVPGSIGSAIGSASQVNQYMTGAAIAPFRANLPLFDPMRQQASTTALSQLRGELPQDVVNQILTRAAERGIGGIGSPGAPASNAAYLRDIGLTSIGQQKAGAEALSSLIKDTPVPELASPWSLYVPERLGAQQVEAARLGRREEREATQAASYTPRSLNSLTYLPTQGGTWGAASPQTSYRYWQSF